MVHAAVKIARKEMPSLLTLEVTWGTVFTGDILDTVVSVEARRFGS